MKKTFLFGNQSLTRFTIGIFAKYFGIFFCCKKSKFLHAYCTQIVDCNYSQVEIVLRKISFHILEYFSNMQVKLISLC